MERNESPEPIFETDDQSTYFLTVLPINPEVSNLVGNQESDQVSDQVKTILSYCTVPHSREEILNHIGLKNHFDNYRRHIEPIIDAGWIAMTIPDKPKSRNQQYLITQKGKETLNAYAVK